MYVDSRVVFLIHKQPYPFDFVCGEFLLFFHFIYLFFVGEKYIISD
jgi:hypothetical protein